MVKTWNSLWSWSGHHYVEWPSGNLSFYLFQSMCIPDPVSRNCGSFFRQPFVSFFTFIPMSLRLNIIIFICVDDFNIALNRWNIGCYFNVNNLGLVWWFKLIIAITVQESMILYLIECMNVCIFMKRYEFLNQAC